MKHTIIEKLELASYTLIGGIATIIDWTVFAIALKVFDFRYQFALISGYVVASFFHYTANKFITFKCKSTAYKSQLSLYLLALTLSLTLSMLILSSLVTIFPINKIYLRIVTTLLMLVPNYLIHKHMTFNKSFFANEQALNLKNT